jgi:hypothetical protein
MLVVESAPVRRHRFKPDGARHGQDPHLCRHRSRRHPQRARGRFFNVVDLVNRLEAEARSGRAGRLAEHLMRLDFDAP